MASDSTLSGEFEENKMRKVLLVGLACSYPDPLASQPCMRGAVHMLIGEAEKLSGVLDSTEKDVNNYSVGLTRSCLRENNIADGLQNKDCTMHTVEVPYWSETSNDTLGKKKVEKPKSLTDFLLAKPKRRVYKPWRETLGLSRF
ncbi:hypothetical protein FNV43_RR19681 [Rhamnella rubrinervis]|uniref:Uncharacterized protein n=1 Tax=Rhamnella rubrinervis TaxID=2594499 RepID=A0A8K0DXA6_9ROSA|nr:hypothetical protein FNV43_RR19681 [Rhamnella rubrinervis]